MSLEMTLAVRTSEVLCSESQRALPGVEAPFPPPSPSRICRRVDLDARAPRRHRVARIPAEELRLDYAVVGELDPQLDASLNFNASTCRGLARDRLQIHQ